MKAIFAAAGLALICTFAARAQTAVSGQVATVEIVAGGGGAPGNGDFRVYLSGSLVQCNGQTWSYVNATDPNYKGILGGILTARASGLPVTLYVSQDSSGYCLIDFMMF